MIIFYTSISRRLRRTLQIILRVTHHPTCALLRPPTHAKYGCMVSAPLCYSDYFLWHNILLQQATDKRPFALTWHGVLPREYICSRHERSELAEQIYLSAGRNLAGPRGATPWVWGCQGAAQGPPDPSGAANKI